VQPTIEDRVMTIETATPSSAETIAALFDTLVDAVAARVLAQLNDNLDARFALLLESADFEDKVEASVQTAVDNLDLDDTIMDAIQSLSFDVSVSR
jgi:histidinol dehydrogenase